MKARHAAFGDASISLSSISRYEASPAIQTVAAIAGLCNDARFVEVEDTAEKDVATDYDEAKALGDSTDIGLLRFSQKMESVEQLRGQWREVGKVPFNSSELYCI
jgi:hypothetical protein